MGCFDFTQWFRCACIQLSIVCSPLVAGSSALLNKAVAAELARQLKLPWTPPLCKTDSTRWTDSNTWHLEVCVCMCECACVSCMCAWLRAFLITVPACCTMMSSFGSTSHPTHTSPTAAGEERSVPLPRCTPISSSGHR